MRAPEQCWRQQELPQRRNPITELLCPKCQAPMRTYERSGVHVDRCTECRGIFLDAGELERVMEAEAGFNQQQGWARQDHDAPPSTSTNRILAADAAATAASWATCSVAATTIDGC